MQDEIVGDSMSLDQAGYEALVAANSISNTKRFVCRVMAKIHCKAIDDKGMSAYLPYYSSRISHQTYVGLEQELMMLCRQDDSWLVPENLAGGR
jgi:hypothetical protein